MKLALAQLLVEGTEPERNFERAEKLIALANGEIGYGEWGDSKHFLKK